MFLAVCRRHRRRGGRDGRRRWTGWEPNLSGRVHRAGGDGADHERVLRVSGRIPATWPAPPRTEASFIAVSRLFDINGILAGLDLAYDHVSPLVASADADLDSRIEEGFTQLVGYVSDLYEEERAGRQFTAAEADLFGTEAQELATTLSALLARAAELLEVRLDLA